ncbi:hypothetical protein NQ317_008365 [Molorchus minor]|uniref:Potassium channel domain-containing protein n=1 Tax=Molorchus minor TaxID=1323400 RepID=A0ABQ9K5C4_9CUCU|nr:hypothetical protein NQ317_008365 [Molorchus minor]
MEGRDRYQRCSSRSKGSSSSDPDPREQIKDCCRKLVAFMCTQVGVGAMVFGYTLIGAVIFMNIEEKVEKDEKLERQLNDTRLNVSLRLFKVALRYNIWDPEAFSNQSDEILLGYQLVIISKLNLLLYRPKDVVVKIFRKGYDPQDNWTFPTALMFSLSIITMIGYGNMVPRTPYGRLATVIYALFGIPLYILYFMNVGDALAGVFRWVYHWIYECSTESPETDHTKKIIVPSTACLWVLVVYVLTGAIMFGAWEQWDFLDSIYFCVTSLCKLGFGDLVPGSSIDASNHANQTKLVINFIYIAFGLALVAMCYNLMREEVREKVKEVREDTAQCLEDTRLRLVAIVNMWRGNDTLRGLILESLNNQVAFFSDVRRYRMLGGQICPYPIRLCNVPGFEGRANDVVCCSPLQNTETPGVVMFFGGDVQDFTENMKSHRDNINYVKWNLENTARLLQLKFLSSFIIVVRPSRMEYKTFSCYENFVPVTKCGSPEHTPMHHSLLHLEKLICNISERLQGMTDSDLHAAMEISEKAIVVENDMAVAADGISEKDQINGEACFDKTLVEKLPNLELKVIGFSKGCIVLNQFLYEFHYFKTLKSDDGTLAKIISRIRDMYWLDGGHSGGKNTWITSRPLLETLTGLDIKIHVHVTPYQIEDDRRPWIKKEEKSFSDTLKRQGANIDRTVHFENINASLLQHFDVIKVF